MRSGLLIVDETIHQITTPLFQTFGTIVFVLIEIFTHGKLGVEAKAQPWDPLTLPKIESVERVKRGEMVVGIGFSLLALLIFNAYPEWISVITIVDNEVTVTPVLSDHFVTFVPWLTVLWSLNIALDAYVLAQGRWRPLTRWLQIGLSALSLAILGWMLVSGPLLAWPALELTARLIVAIIFVVTAVDMIVQVYRLVVRRIAHSSAQAT